MLSGIYTTEQKPEDIARDFLKFSWGEGDFDALRRLAVPQFYYQTTFNENILDIDQYIGFVSTFRKTMPELILDIEESMSDGGRVMTYVSFSGSVEQPFYGIPPTSKIITFPAVSLWNIENNKVKTLNTLIDISGVERQLGVTLSPSQPLDVDDLLED